jgi:hypothetical protein
MCNPKPANGRSGRRLLQLCLSLSLAALFVGCGLLADRSDEFGTRSPAAGQGRADAASAQGKNQCVPEGQSCAAANAVCCPGTTCSGTGHGICILAY